MRRPVDVNAHFRFLLSVSRFRFSQAASVAILPSALFVERLSLGASWVFSFQWCCYLIIDLCSTDSVRVGPQDLVAVTWTRRLSSALRTQFYATVLTPSQC